MINDHWNKFQSGDSLEPAVATLIKKTLEDLGELKYESGVLVMLFYFVLQYAQKLKLTFSSNLPKEMNISSMSINDCKLGLVIQASKFLNHLSEYSLEYPLKLDKQKNEKPLPKISNHRGLKLPHHDDCLIMPNFDTITKIDETNNKTNKKDLK
jgi:hypothetical protein